MARILYVTNTRSRFIDIDRELLAERHEVEELFCRPGRLDPLAIGRAVRSADLVMGWFAAWHMVVPLLWARALGKPSLLIVGGFDVAAMPGIGYGDQRRGVRRHIGRWVMRSATGLMTNSAFSRDEAAANTGIPAERFEVVHHGVRDPFGSLPPGERPDRALTVGAVVRSNLHRKGHETFVRAAALLPDVEFVLVGGWGDDAIDRLRSLAGPNVTFTGRIDDAALEERYRTASVYVQPSRHEGFGMSVAEAMLGGCVPVVTRAGALPEVVGEAGVYAASHEPAAVAEAVRTALRSGSDAREAARRRVLERFTIERRRDGLLGLVERTLGGGTVRPGIGEGHDASGGAPRVLPVSVVIPFYDGNDTIRRAIASVEAQTARPREILVVDDGSPEPVAPDRLRSEIEVRVLRHERNQGIPAARNTAIRAAREDWIALLDQDDEWVPEKLAWQWEALERAGAGEDTLVFGRLLLPGDGDGPAWVFPDPRSIDRMERGGDTALRELVRHGCVVPPVTLLFHRGLLDRHGWLDETLRGGADDYELALRMAAAGARFVCDASASGGRPSAIRHHTGRNYSAHAPRYLRDDLRIVEKLSARYPAIAGLREEALARVRYAFGRHYDRAGARRRALASYRMATRLDPWWPKPWVARARLALPRPVQRWMARVWTRLESLRRETVPR